MLERRVRTAKYLVFRTRENPWKQRETGGRKSLSCGGFRVSPVMTTSIPLRVCQTRSEHLEPQKRGKTKMLERRVRTAKYLVFRTRENPWKQRETGGRKSLSCGGFRVSPVMTTSIPLRICSSSKVRETIVIQFFRKPVRYDGQKNHQPSESPIKSSFSGGFRWYNYSNAHMISDVIVSFGKCYAKW